MRYCPQCHTATRVIETRDVRARSITRRRRECKNCRHRFTTYEMQTISVVVNEREVAPVEMPSSYEIAQDVVAELTDQLDYISDSLGEVPGATVGAMISEAARRKVIDSTDVPELEAGGDEDD